MLLIAIFIYCFPFLCRPAMYVYSQHTKMMNANALVYRELFIQSSVPSFTLCAELTFRVILFRI